MTPSGCQLPRFIRDDVTKYTSPTASSRMRSRTLFTDGLYRNVWPGMSVRPRCSAMSTSSCAWATVLAMGFSTMTCLSASSAC